ncbi:protein-disulfide reductase DsbD [Legionella jamestowniensis]|uniref:Thiol:disulfide interchange protein DsbD n=1 Tax=Legionella jamestowniensis TaxID=455 RepID=A0A0W0V092_9GAMM|nr:protein-disulfide reductase DsbD [Legionella jamestowniensis]KTD13341.1 thiol:disulfide interchange protein DsbD [Legionella jamestowniensis]SFL76805.1 Thiol:disulfide interchange protein DsbD [Legionella jamestowniensis DSM 19215]
MNNLKRYAGVLTLMLISHAVWSFSPGFESSNPLTIMHFIQNHSALVYLSVFFGLGILLAFTPCVLPMVPILSGIIVGQRSLSTAKAVKLSSSYVLGMAITYAAAGVLAGYMGSTLQTWMQRPVVIILFSLVFVLMALSMFGLFELRLPEKITTHLTSLSKKSGHANVVSVIFMGIISTLVVSPCVTAPLIGVLTYIGQSGEAWMGGVILFVMALGMGIPLMLVGAGQGALLPRTGSWMLKVKQLFGFLMLAMTVWMLGRLLPDTWVKLAWAALLIVGSISMGSLRTQTSQWGKLIQGVGVIILMGGGILAYSTISTIVASQESRTIHTIKAPFIHVDNLAAINKHLAEAQQTHKAVFLEFYASWCSDCQEMDTKVFNQPEVSKAMSGLINLKVNLSDTANPEVKKIKETFAIYGTPTMLFFDTDGKPLDKLNAVGFIDKQALIVLLEQVHKSRHVG